MQKTIKVSSILAFAAVGVCAVALVAALSTVHAQADVTVKTAADLTDNDLRSISSKCVSAQSKVRTLQQQITDVSTKRTKVYDQIDARLYIAIGKSKIGGKDTADLEKVRTELSDKVGKSTALTQAYNQTLGELSQVGCKEDPAGFQTSLDSTRRQLAEIRALNTEIRDYVNNDTKSAISSLTAKGDDSSSDSSSDTE